MQQEKKTPDLQEKNNSNDVFLIRKHEIQTEVEQYFRSAKKIIVNPESYS